MRHFLLTVPIILSALFTLPAPLQAQTDEQSLEWSSVSKPGLPGNIVVTPSEVNEITVTSGGTIYALDTSANSTKLSKVYQSVNGGASWVDITAHLFDAGAVLPATRIAAAPDRTGFLAVVTDNGTAVYMSTNGGSTWTNLYVPVLAGKIQAIAISRQYSESGTTLTEIAIGTAVWGNNTTTGQIWVCQIGTLWSSWYNQNLTIDPAHIGGEVSAIAYSPNYKRGFDNTIIVVASSANSDVALAYQSQTWLCLGQRHTDVGTTTWNNAVFAGYPVAVGAASAGDAVGVLQISSSLGVPSNFSTSDTDLMRLFISYNRDPDAVPANEDVYRIDDTTVYRLNTNGGASINISSLDYYGTTMAGKLLTGDVSQIGISLTVQVRRTANPFNLAPTWYVASLPPSGPGNARVRWSPDGSTAYCGTGQIPGVALDESAFSSSTDGGDNWQQQSLMDTILNISDLAVTPDSKTIFLATYSATGHQSVWRSTLTEWGIGVYWSRQLNISTISQRIFLRLSPNYLSDYTIYVVESGGIVLDVSHNRGNSWKHRLTLNTTVDAVVANEFTLYIAMVGGNFSCTTDGGYAWSYPVPTGIANINMLTIAANGTILVGGRNGEVAYSTNGGASFTRIFRTIGTGDVQVAADADYQENGIIYAASNVSDSGIWRWQIGRSTSWEQIDKSITDLGTGQRIGGLVTGSEGTLYALRMEAAGGMSRSLYPTVTGNNVTPEFDIANQGLPAGTTFDPSALFSHTLPYLKFSTETGQNELWSVDTVHEIIYRYKDTLSTSTPGQVTPANVYQDMTNAITGKAYDIVFSWNSPSLNVTNYETGVYADAACTMPVQICYIASTSPLTTIIFGPYQSGNQCIDYTPGTVYYWRVRVTGPIKSPWSTTFSFSIASLRELVTSLLSPLNGAIDISQTPAFSWSPIAGASNYQLMLAENASFTSPLVSAIVNDTGLTVTEKLEYGKVYFWKVRVVSPVESDWSTIANFIVKEAPTEPSPPVVITQAPAQTTVFTLTAPALEIFVPSPPASTTVPVTIWVIIGIGSVLVIALIVLIVRTRR
ncbi:MAG: hypothetical protein ACYDG5_02310 [Dehalococcoidales bacterium]